MNDKQLPEAGAVAFFSYKRLDGFEVSLTLRDSDGKTVLDRIQGAIEAVKGQGCTPLPLRSATFAKKPLDKVYVEGRVCPLDGGKLLKGSDATKWAEKCENGKWDAATRKTIGCNHIVWKQTTH